MGRQGSDDRVMRQTHRLSSTAIRYVAYDPETSELEVTFTNGSTYSHSDVPPEVAEGLINAGSPGSYYNSTIKGVYV